MKLTVEQIEAAKTTKGGYRLAQLMALGYHPPLPGQFPSKGWKSRLTQREITEAQYAEFVRLGQGNKKETNAILQADRKRIRTGNEPELFHKPVQKQTVDRDQAARDHANSEWMNNRESFERIPSPPCARTSAAGS